MLKVTGLKRLDIQILEILQKDASYSRKEIADHVHRSESVVYERIQYLYNEGYIQAALVLLNPEKIQMLIAYTQIKLKEHTAEVLTRFQEYIIPCPEVLECYHVTGTYDFVLRIAVADMNQYTSFVKNTLSCIAFLGEVKSSMVITEVKRQTAYPLEPSA